MLKMKPKTVKNQVFAIFRDKPFGKTLDARP